MDASQPKYPVPKQDRRKRARSRLSNADRRRHVRYVGRFPVTIHVGAGDAAKVYHGTARDISEGGLLIECADVPPTETRIRVDFAIPEGVMPEEFSHGRLSAEGEVRRRDEGARLVGLQFTTPLSARLAGTWRALRSVAVLAFLVALLFVTLIKLDNIYYFWFDVPVFLYSVAVGGYLLSRFLFAAFYRPPAPRADRLPSVSVIFPVFNEEHYIERTLTQALEADYPRDRLQVIAVNDGSRDGSFAIMQKVQQKYPELVLVNLEKSMGKRGALAAGAQLATGELLVLSDSDSFFAPDALRNIIDGFADPEVLAVTGHCDVENAWTNLLTRMQAVRYYVAFRVMKAAESVFGAVTCLSGPFAAYRREAFMEEVDDWLHQRWFGRPALFGDDRALTNALLRRGGRVIYDARARCTTIVPEDYRTFFAQQMRWKRSWIRESMRAAMFMWKRPPFASISFYLGVALPLLAPLIVLRALVLSPLLERGSPLSFIFGILLMSALVSSVYLFARRSRLWIYGIPFCLFYMFVLVWQMPWALLTTTHGKWGTRD